MEDVYRSNNSISVLDQAELIVNDANQDLGIEKRIEKQLEISQSIRLQQESIRLIDRIRNTESDISISINCQSFPIVTGQIRFTSNRFLVITSQISTFFVNLSAINYLTGVDSKAIFRVENKDLDTSSMWLKNLTESLSQVCIYLFSGTQLFGNLTRFSVDHLDLKTSSEVLVIPLNSIALLRSSHEN